MLCQNCKKNPATVHFKSVVDGHETAWDLCAACAEQKGVAAAFGTVFPLGPAPFESLSELIAQLADVALPESAKPAALKCGHCGLAYADFHARGQFGCAHCYDAFAPALEPLLKHVHGHVRHEGKTYVPPAGAAATPPGGGPIKAREIESLEKKLKEAIRKEDFEEAARLRDRLRRLKKG